MLKSKVITVQIHAPLDRVYEFCAEPLNFPLWAANFGSDMQRLSEHEWLVEVPRGRIVIRFAERNDWGVLDYCTYAQGESDGPVTPVRAIRNGEGSELQFVWFQRPGVDDARFASDVEWIASDLNRLKSLIESGA